MSDYQVPEFVREGGHGDTQGRNVELFRYGAHLQGCALDDATVAFEMATFNATKCIPPLDDRELARVTQSVLQRAKGEPREDYGEPITRKLARTSTPKKMDELPPVEQTIAQLGALFEPGETCCIVTGAAQDGAGKWRPASRGTFYRVDELVDDLRARGFEALGPLNSEAGAWIVCNPVNGDGRGDRDVLTFRNALVESDTLPTEQQKARLLESGLPVTTLTASGAKSIHALVRIDADGPAHYAERVAETYAFLESVGFEVDAANRNPARLTRLAGVQRGGRTQALIHINTGARDFATWRAAHKVAEQPAEPPAQPPLKVEKLRLETEPVLSPPLIDGILREGHKMILSGPSKAYKSWMLINLALSIATGSPWLGFDCKQGAVLMINAEVAAPSYASRVRCVAERRALDLARCDENLDVIHLRGRCKPLEELWPALVAAASARSYAAVVIDPIYKVASGDENSAADVRRLVGAMDALAENTGAAVIYCHHHSKGAQGDKSAIDRASGSGVFARDADAILDLIQLDAEAVEGLDETTSAWRLSFCLREFSTPEPVNLFYRWPLHIRDYEGTLAKCKPFSPAQKGGTKTGERASADRRARQDSLVALAVRLIGENHGEPIPRDDLVAKSEFSARTVASYLKESAALETVYDPDTSRALVALAAPVRG